MLLNKNTKKIYLILAIVFLMSLTGCSKSSPQTSTEVVTIPPGKILFVSKTCQHCSAVKEYVAEHNVLQKIYFVYRDVATDDEAYKIFPVVGQKCGLTKAQLGVPLFWDGQKCYIGETNIVKYFETLP